MLYRKVRDHFYFTGKYRGTTHSICNLKFNGLNEIRVVSRSSSNYDYHFIIKELTNVFQGQFQCLGENTKKRNIFFVPIEKKVIKIDKDGNENVISISYKIKFIDKPRFMASSSSNLVDNLAEGIHIIKSKDCDCFLEYESIIDNLIKCKSLSCNKDYSNNLDEKLKK